MFYYVDGTVSVLQTGLAVIDCGGVGYACHASQNTISRLKIGTKARLLTYLNVREGIFELYGFIDEEEKSCFEMMIGVSGVGPKAALSILSVAPPDRLALSIITGDEKMLTQAPGIGKKIAQRIVLELRDKMSKEQLESASAASPVAAADLSGGVNHTQEAVAALMVLGYTQAEALHAMNAKFGIVLCGGCGNGKTTMLKALQNLVRRLEILKPNLSPNAGHSSDNYYSFTIVNAMQIVQIRKTDYNKFCKLAEADILGIDDIGTEPAEVQDYGNFIYPIKELLAMRYDAQLFTVFTTNLEPKEIRQRYGDRIADRLNEMMTKVVFRNPTYRTENAQMADSQG